MTDMDRFIEAADALAEAVAMAKELSVTGLISFNKYGFNEDADIEKHYDAVQTEYRAAREAITRGAPPAPEDQTHD